MKHTVKLSLKLSTPGPSDYKIKNPDVESRARSPIRYTMAKARRWSTNIDPQFKDFDTITAKNHILHNHPRSVFGKAPRIINLEVFNAKYRDTIRKGIFLF